MHKAAKSSSAKVIFSASRISRPRKLLPRVISDLGTHLASRERNAGNIRICVSVERDRRNEANLTTAEKKASIELWSNGTGSGGKDGPHQQRQHGRRAA
jgi:hypothetical protein